MKNAYLLLTDLHYNVRKEHRVNYFAEVLAVLDQVMAVERKYHEQGYTTKLIFLGDVVDGPISNPEEAMRCQDLLTFVCKQFTEAYCVLGNHEENNTTNNPFWFLISTIEDKALSKLERPIQAQGVFSSIKVVDKIEDGNVRIYFNHFGITPKVPEVHDGTVNIGLFHQNVGSNDICKMWGTFENVEETACVRPYQYCFFGHMHLAEGRYYVDEKEQCLCEWLGSSVGTNVTEVQEQKQECIVPVILVDEGNLSQIAREKIKRSDPSKAIDFRQLSMTQQSKAKLSEVKARSVQNVAGDSLYERVVTAAGLADLSVLVELLALPYEQVKRDYQTGLKQEFMEVPENGV